MDVLDLIIQKRRRELQRESPEVDVTDALKSTIMSLIREGVDVDRLQEPRKRTQVTPQESDEEESESNDFEDVIEDIIQKFIDEQGTSTTNTLKIEVIDNPQAAEGDELPFLVTAEIRVGEREDQQRNISIKVINLVEFPSKLKTHQMKGISQQKRTEKLNLKRLSQL